MLKICSLGSGSRGNCIFIGSDDTKILIDAGFSALKIKNRLKEINECIDEIDAILITHEHQDHIKGIKTLSKYHNIPILFSKDFPELYYEKVTVKDFFAPGEEFKIKNFEISSFAVPHDAIDPVAFTVKFKNIKIGIATDIGKPNLLIKNRLLNCNVIFLEFNHDEQMLLYGPYPWELKQRIRSGYGHLSNDMAASLLKEIEWEGLRHVFISHISEKNNSLEKIKRVIISKNFSPQMKFYFTFQERVSKKIFID